MDNRAGKLGLKGLWGDRTACGPHWMRQAICALPLLTLVVAACRPSAPPDEIQRSPPALEETVVVEVESADPSPKPTHTTVADPDPTSLSPAYPVETTGTPTATAESGPLGRPTRLPEPYLIRILDWELVQEISPALCPGCGPGQTVVSAPRGMGIVLLRVFSGGGVPTRMIIRTDLAYAEELFCDVTEEASYCGAIFGQVEAGQLTIFSEAEGGTDSEIKYYLTFQKWADYSP